MLIRCWATAHTESGNGACECGCQHQPKRPCHWERSRIEWATGMTQSGARHHAYGQQTNAAHRHQMHAHAQHTRLPLSDAHDD